MGEMTQVQKMLVEQFWPHANTKAEQDILTVLGLGAKSSGIEEDVLAFVSEHPDASIQELGAQFLPDECPLEIVDDELDEEERNPAVYED